MGAWLIYATCSLSLLLLSSTLVTITTASNIEQEGSISIRLRHAISGVMENTPYYTERGNITIQSTRTSAYLSPVTINQNPLTSTEQHNLKMLADMDGFYRLEAIVHSWDGTETKFLTSVKADTLLFSGLCDSLTVWLMHDGSPISVSSAVSSSLPVSYEIPNRFTTDVFVKHVEQAPIPDTASYIQKLEKEKEAREKGELKDNRSFFSKYWMYIVPIALLVIISGAANPDQPSNAR